MLLGFTVLDAGWCAELEIGWRTGSREKLGKDVGGIVVDACAMVEYASDVEGRLSDEGRRKMVGDAVLGLTAREAALGLAVVGVVVKRLAVA